jgi:hypothetical protein
MLMAVGAAVRSRAFRGVSVTNSLTGGLKAFTDKDIAVWNFVESVVLDSAAIAESTSLDGLLPQAVNPTSVAVVRNN